MSVYHLRTFALARQQAWRNPTYVGGGSPVIQRGVTGGGVTINIDDELVSSLGSHIDDIVIPRWRHGTVSWTQTATYEQILYVLHGLFGAVTPTGSAAPYEWTYLLSKDETVTPAVYTIEYGFPNEQPFYLIRDTLISSVTFRGETNNVLELEVEGLFPFAPAQTTGAHTWTEPDPPSIISLNNSTSISIGNLDGPINTPLQSTVISFELTISPGRHLKWFLGGDPAYGDKKWDVSGSIVLEYNAVTRALIANALADVTQRALRLSFARTVGTVLHELIIDCGMTITDSVELFRDRDGNAIVEFQFTGTPSNAIGGAIVAIAVKNAVSTLP